MEIIGIIFGFACLVHMFGLDEKRQAEEEMEMMSRHMKKDQDG